MATSVAMSCDRARIVAATSRGAAVGGDEFEQIVVDEPDHLGPAALLGQQVQLGLEVAVTVHLEHRSIGGCRTVEREQAPGRVDGGVELLLGAAGGHDDLRDHREVRTGAPGRGESGVDARQDRFANESVGGERHHQQAVGMFGDRAGEARPPNAPTKMGGTPPCGLGPGLNIGVMSRWR